MNNNHQFMKNILSCIFCLIVANSLQAQNENKGIYMGLNAARMLQLMSDNASAKSINPYLIELGYMTPKLGFRANFGFDKSQSIIQPSAGNANILTQRDSSNSDWRLGAFYPIAVMGKWQMNIGLDYYQSSVNRLMKTEFTNENNESVEDEKTYDYKESGISPSIGVQFRPHPKVSIGTELVLRLGKNSLSEKSTSNLFPEFDAEIMTEGSRNYFIAPSALFICLTL
jgi:hypothetical protein